ncbi:MAG: NfeD family protein [Ectothiorhodospiraceae bacterium]|nr:NfeD family protein [Ectothiorhodospiraceae bacterium]
MGTLIRYTLLQIPGLVLAAALLWWGVSLGWLRLHAALVLFLLWLLKDILLYPLYRPALERRVPHGARALVGRSATVSVGLNPVGRVRVASESWRARCRGGEPVPAGRRVRVVDARDLMLIVEPHEPGPENGTGD